MYENICMSNLARVNIYKTQALFFEMQQFGQTIMCWFSGSYNTVQVKFCTHLFLEILEKNFRFRRSIKNVASSFYKTTSNSRLQKLHQELNFLHTSMNHLVVGNSVGFQKALRVRGVGYRFELSPLKITIQAGYSHLLFQKLASVSSIKSFILNKKATQIYFKGYHLMNLNSFVSAIRNLRRPDVYKGKGIRYQKDLVPRKEGKKKKIS